MIALVVKNGFKKNIKNALHKLHEVVTNNVI